VLNLGNKIYDSLIEKEWLVTNGLGGYASSSIIGTNTRRYHGLLVAAFNPPTDRKVLVSKVEEVVKVGDQIHQLSTTQYPGAIHPQGFTYFHGFERDPLPKAVFANESFRLQKTVFMVYGENTTVVGYENLGDTPIELSISPWMVYRDYHSLFQESSYFDFYVEQVDATFLKVYPHYGAAPVQIQYEKGNFDPHSIWCQSIEYAAEQERGLDYQEAAKSIGQITVQLAAGEKMYLRFSTHEQAENVSFEELEKREIQRIESLGQGQKNNFLRDLMIAGDQFLVHRASTNSSTLIAGYPWFTDWGRDTMIAMRGLTIAQGNQEASKSILRTFLQYLDQGMLPNRFPDQGEAPEYNTIDATLWLFVVLHEYYEKFQDLDFIAELYPKLQDVLHWHIEGTRYNIHVTPEGLLFGGEGLAQLTWMDARVGDYVVTPRQGCPVEINALWYNALQIFSAFAKLLNEEHQKYLKLADQVKTAFRHFFINDEGFLNDVIIPDGYVDQSFRPNQLYAISLPFSLLNKTESAKVLSMIEDHLCTDYGLRSLNVEDPAFKGHYGGNQWERDTAYHQGTVWTFLWAEYALAFLKVKGNTQKSSKELMTKLRFLENHFYESDCIQGISEIFDGANPNKGKGCIQQAWSIGMLIKVLFDLQNKA
jgi:predicted glycogen debranching enzyme